MQNFMMLDGEVAGMAGSKNDGSRTVKTVEKSFEILEALQGLGGGRVSEVAEEVEMSKSTVHRYLVTLLEQEYVVKEGDEYRIGFRFLDIGESAKKRKKAYKLVGARLEELAEETKERVVFLVEEHGQAVYVHRATGTHAVRSEPGPGKRIPLHATASGKAILAYMPEERVDEIVDWRGLTDRTENTIVDRESLKEELATIRDRGYAINEQENARGVRAIGVPVRPYGRVVGAIAVSGACQRIKEETVEKKIINILLSTANEVELVISKTDWTVS
jgi:DNA-binding IclR family transcriptional regulator